jgi:hypothetical protein
MKNRITGTGIRCPGCMALLLTAMLLCLTACPGRQDFIMVDFRPGWDTLKVLENPHKGWYHHYFDNGIHRYHIQDRQMLADFPGMDHFYLRLSWAFLEPEEGRFNWQVIDTIIEKYRPMGYKFAFRITSKETGPIREAVPEEIDGVRFATPSWVKRAGAKGVVPDPPDSPSWTPVWDDPVYLEKLNNFHRAFAQRYDDKPWALYTDVGSIGEWGEGHTHFSTRIPPTVQEVKANIDIYLENYKNMQIVVTDDLLYWGKSAEDVRTLYDYAVSNGITLRDDSPMVDWYLQNNLDTWSVSHPHFFDPLYLDRPVIYELQHYLHVKRDGNWLGKNGEDTIPTLGFSGADIFRNSIRTMRATYIGYHGYLEEFYTDNPDLSGELQNLCGYWYFPVSASYRSEVTGSGNTVSVQWLNRGVAPAYNDYSIIFLFGEAGSDRSFRLTLDSGNRNWLPGVQVGENYDIELPPGISPGKYNLRFKLMDTKSPEPREVFTGIRDGMTDNENFISLGQVEIL